MPRTGTRDSVGLEGLLPTLARNHNPCYRCCLGTYMLPVSACFVAPGLVNFHHKEDQAQVWINRRVTAMIFRLAICWLAFLEAIVGGETGCHKVVVREKRYF